MLLTDLKNVMKTLGDAEKQFSVQTGKDWKPHAFPGSCQQDIDQHNQLVLTIKSLKQPMGIIKTKSDELQSTSLTTDSKDVETLTGVMNDMQNRHKHLMTAVEYKEV